MIDIDAQAHNAGWLRRRKPFKEVASRFTRSDFSALREYNHSHDPHSHFREFNRNHAPAGSPAGGQFTSGPSSAEHLVGITSARPPGDPQHQPNQVVGQTMRDFQQTLKGLPGVSRVSVVPAMGQWNGGSELSWAVSYDGNGAARRLLAKTGQAWNQDAVLLMTKSHSAKHDLIYEMAFSSVPKAARDAMAPLMEKAGLGGWTYFKRGGQTVLRAVSVPAWGGNNRTHFQSIRRVQRVFRQAGMSPLATHVIRGYRSSVLAREAAPGVDSYARVLEGS